jgi:cytochrome c-type biogenesis protein CcmH/NrfG
MAASQFETALQLDPNNLTALYQLGLAYRNQGRKEDSRRLFDRFRAAKGKASEQEISQIQILRILLGRSGT